MVPRQLALQHPLQRTGLLVKHVLVDVEFLEYQRRDHLEAAMVGKLAELCGGGDDGSAGASASGKMAT